MNRRRLLSIFPFSLFAGKAVAAERKPQLVFRCPDCGNVVKLHPADLPVGCHRDGCSNIQEPLVPSRLPRVIESLDFSPEADYSVAVYRRLPNGTSEMVSHRLISANDNPDAVIFSRDLLSPAYPPVLVVDNPAPLSKRP